MHSVSEGESLLEEEARCNSLMSAAATAAAAKAPAPETPSQTAAVMAVRAPTAPVQQTQADTAYDESEAGAASRSGVPTPLKLDYDSLDIGEAAYLLGDSEGSYFLDR